MLSRRAERVAIAEAASAAIDRCGLGPLVTRRAGGLSTGQRRLVELARALAGRFRVLLLDEPSSGLDDRETARFGDVLVQTVREDDVGILLVEHDMALVMAICEYIYVLDFGEMVFEGVPADVITSDIVRAATWARRFPPDMLELRGIRAGYGETTVLRDVNLTVPAGSVVALLGPNGAGKTTLLRVASGLLAPTAGAVLLDGLDIGRLAPHELARRGVCHIPEGRGVFPSLTVRENVVLQATPGEETPAIERAVEAFPALSNLLGQPAGTLSGGEQQMLALARAYVTKPRLVLADEVSMGLAPKVVDAIFEFFARLAADGAAMQLVEQYVMRALKAADYVYMMNRGSIVFAGEPAELEQEDVFQSYLGVEVGGS